MCLRIQRRVSVRSFSSFSAFYLADIFCLFFWGGGGAVAVSTVLDDPNLPLFSFMFPLELNEL
jgi:hypothetical protein